MLVTKNCLYKELNQVVDVIEECNNNLLDNIMEARGRIRKVYREIDDVKERINYTLDKMLELTGRIEALEAKRHHKSEKKTTKKTKGK